MSDKEEVRKMDINIPGDNNTLKRQVLGIFSEEIYKSLREAK